MAEDIKGLLEKIQEEGIRRAQAQAEQVLAAARTKADTLVAEARAQIERQRADAERDAARSQERAAAAIQQAGRDLLLALRQEINATLERVTRQSVRDTLTPEALEKIIHALIASGVHEKEGEIKISVSESDAKKLKHSLHAKVSGEIKKGITLATGSDISAGFIISYDSGKSHYDFSDAALAEYLGKRLRPYLAELLCGVTS